MTRNWFLITLVAVFLFPACQKEERIPLPKIPSYTVCLSDFGGIGDGVFLNTEVFSHALAHLSERGGGVLTVPAGIWFTGPITLPSCTELRVEKDAVIVAVGDTCAALLAGLAIMPACSAFGIDFGAGPGLLFVSMPTVFNDMKGGAIFAFLFWLLVFFACLSSSIGMMEGGISAILDSRIKAGKSANRFGVTMVMAAWALIGNMMTTLDGLGERTTMQWFHLFGIPDVLDVWDAVAEGILMPLTGLIMAILIGWVVPHYIDDEVESSSAFKSKGFFNFCIKWLGPLFMVLIVWGQIQSVMSLTQG